MIEIWTGRTLTYRIGKSSYCAQDPRPIGYRFTDNTELAPAFRRWSASNQAVYDPVQENLKPDATRASKMREKMRFSSGQLKSVSSIQADQGAKTQ